MGLQEGGGPRPPPSWSGDGGWAAAPSERGVRKIDRPRCVVTRLMTGWREPGRSRASRAEGATWTAAPRSGRVDPGDGGGLDKFERWRDTGIRSCDAFLFAHGQGTPSAGCPQPHSRSTTSQQGSGVVRSLGHALGNDLRVVQSAVRTSNSRPKRPRSIWEVAGVIVGDRGARSITWFQRHRRTWWRWSRRVGLLASVAAAVFLVGTPPGARRDALSAALDEAQRLAVVAVEAGGACLFLMLIPSFVRVIRAVAAAAVKAIDTSLASAIESRVKKWGEKR
jgi:hypothetical protein